MKKKEQTIEQFYRFYETENVSYKNELKTDDLLNDSFTLKLRLRRLPKDGEKLPLIECANLLNVFAEGLNAARDEAGMSEYEKNEMLFVYADENGFSPALRAELFLSSEFHPEWKKFSLSVPLYLFDAVNEDICLQYDGVCLRFLFRGEEINAEYPFGQFAAPQGEAAVHTENLAAFGVFCGALPAVRKSELLHRGIAFYSPRGYNAWAGDVVNFYRDGIYHLLYFYDRHHHMSRYACGAHHMRHLTTKDFLHWIDHGPVTEVAAQWQTVGTGTMFFHKGKYYYCHGYHTNRMLPNEKLASVLLSDGFERRGYVESVPYAEIEKRGLFPDGANYIVSENGVDFVSGEKEFHWAENPSIYSKDENTLVMYCGFGTWEAEGIDGKWRLKDPSFPPSGKTTSMKNTAECPSFFSMNGYKYLMMGWTGFWQTGKDGEVFRDVAAQGYDIYDGVGVPMAVKTDEGRVILAGWLYGHGWGSLIVHREILQFENGRLGTRWLPECSPLAEDCELLSAKVPENGEKTALPAKTSLYFEFEIEPEENAKFALRFSGRGEACVFLLDTAEKIAEISSSGEDEIFSHEPILPAYLAIPKACERENADYVVYLKGADDLPYKAKNFALPHVEGIDKPYRLRAVLHYEPKTDSNFLDFEIAGRRTLVSNRVGLRAECVAVYAQHAKIISQKTFRWEE